MTHCAPQARAFIIATQPITNAPTAHKIKYHAASPTQSRAVTA
jgi:hypothetical protein